MDPDFLHNKFNTSDLQNCRSDEVCHGVSFHPSLSSFSLQYSLKHDKILKGHVNKLVCSAYYVTQTQPLTFVT